MYLPKLNEISQSRMFLDTFYGINEGPVIGEGEFSSMKNLSSDHYPAMGTRRKRSAYDYLPDNMEPWEWDYPEEKEEVLGMIAKEKLFVITGYKAKDSMGGFFTYMNVYYGDEVFDGKKGLGLKYSKKTLVSMGAYVCIFPDKIWFNTATMEYGPMEAYFDMSTADMETAKQTSRNSMMIISGSDINGNMINVLYRSKEEPENPIDSARWLDISGEEYKLKRFDAESGLWINMDTYIKIDWTGIGKYFQKDEVVEVKGFHFNNGEVDYMKEKVINGFHRVAGTGENYLILEADEAVYGITWDFEWDNSADKGHVSISRSVPDMDFMTECNNRIWGCKYGIVDGEFINEIYACKQGDVKSWYAYEGISTDSYALSVGSDGPFTGAVTYLGYPTFFKENQILRIYGNMPSEYQLVPTECRGVEKGSEKSLCEVNGILYYKAPQEICAYDGSMPVGVSEKLQYYYKNGIAGRFGKKYYISLEKDGIRHMMVYDTVKGLWHEEDNLEVEDMEPYAGDLLLLVDGDLWSARGEDGEKEKDFNWEAVSGVIGYSYPDKKYLSRFSIRAQMEPGSVFRVYLEYDSSGRFEYAGEGKVMRTGTVTIPVRPRRCDHMRMKLSGKGACRIFSISKVLEIGSDM